MEALGCKGGRKKPANKDVCMVIGWGAKTKDNVALGSIPVLNHPDKIRDNRNKLGALELMQKAKVAVAAFTDNISKIGAAGSKTAVKLPVVGRTKYHQGGKGFWTCPTMSQVQAAANEGASYFQNMIEIKDEFRLHTFGGKVVYAVKKVKRTTAEIEEAYIRHELDRQKNIAEHQNEAFSEEAVLPFLRRQAKKFAQDGANMLIRSNRLGWKFVRVKTIDKALEKEAINALKAIGLDFGAVDCCVDVKGKPFIIEVNTGPGLEETPFNAWVEAFKETITTTLNPKSTMQKVKETLNTKKPTSTATTKVGGRKESLTKTVDLMRQMVEVADEGEAAALSSVFGKMFKD
jgi:glutathione synthase/RimK-type ligase-like ATP-grasp enzyme